MFWDTLSGQHHLFFSSSCTWFNSKFILAKCNRGYRCFLSMAIIYNISNNSPDCLTDAGDPRVGGAGDVIDDEVAIHARFVVAGACFVQRLVLHQRDPLRQEVPRAFDR